MARTGKRYTEEQIIGIADPSASLLRPAHRTSPLTPWQGGDHMTVKNLGTFVLVPVTREKSHHITVEARLAGRPARFIIDTGAGGTIVDLSLRPSTS